MREELEKQCAIDGIFRDGFKFRSLTAVHPELIRRMEKNAYYKGKSVAVDRKCEKQFMRQVQAVKGQMEGEAIYSKESVKNNTIDVFKNCEDSIFDEEFDFMKGWFFDEACDLKRQYSGMMYIHALFAKYHATRIPFLPSMWAHLGHFVSSLCFLACVIILDIQNPTGPGRAYFMGFGKKELEGEVETVVSVDEGRSTIYWVYVGLATLALFKLFGAYWRYFNASIVDLNRRRHLL